MNGAESPRWAFRLEQAEISRLVWALVLSLALHLLVGGIYGLGKKFGWWQRLHAIRLIQPGRMLTDLLPKKPNPPEPSPVSQEIPLMFVEVSPAQATVEPPADAKYYSSRNSRAANPTAEQDVEIPKIEGRQEQVVKTEDIPREKFVPLQPALPPAAIPQEEQKARPAEKPGDLALARPDPAPQRDPGQDVRSRPRTVKEALARLQSTQIPGEKMRQEGGVRRKLEIASLDAKATPFGAYDAMLVEAISQRWFSLLDERDYALEGRGKVELRFRLHQDGRITDLDVAENSASEVLGLICLKAVRDPAPFAAWPSEMRRLMGESRSIRFTFYYN